MKINDILNESIETHGTDFVAYCIVIAEEYNKLPKLDPEVETLWEDVALHNEKMLKRILSKVNVIFTKDDPYKNQREMMFDILINKQLKIFKTQDDSHPSLSDYENDIFRTVHDYLGHYLPNAKEFSKFLAKNNINKPQGNIFKSIRFSKNSFTVRGEINTYLSHIKLLPEKLHPVLFTEIVGQICTYFITNDYTINKVAIFNGVDFKNIGNFTTDKLTKRKAMFKSFLDDENINEFETKIGIINKNNIRWNLLSRGEG